MKKIVLVLLLLTSVFSHAKEKIKKEREPNQVTGNFGKDSKSNLLVFKKNGQVVFENTKQVARDSLDLLTGARSEYSVVYKNIDYNYSDLAKQISSGNFDPKELVDFRLNLIAFTNDYYETVKDTAEYKENRLSGTILTATGQLIDLLRDAESKNFIIKLKKNL